MEGSAEQRSKPWQPLIHFFLLGLVVFGLKAWFERPGTESRNEQLIEITTSDLDWFRAIFRKRMGRDPFAEELQAQVDQLVKEHVLSREAGQLGLDQNDDALRRRLAQKMDYMIRELASDVKPDDEELQAYLHANRSRYEIPAVISFEQVLFKTDQRGEPGAELAIAMFIDHPQRESDPTMLPRMNTKQTGAQVQGTYGKEFAASIQSLETGTWKGPVRSGYGLHAVFVHEHTASTLPDAAEIKDRLVADWSDEKQREVSAEAYKALLDKYQVLLEGMPYDTK